jgi:chemotaxis methyl-accepting protein methylase
LADGGLMGSGTHTHGTAVAFDSILGLLRDRTGADLTRYRASTVTRRVLNRMISVGARTFDDYLLLLGADAAEATHLLDRVTIKVSRFYRNAAVFEALRTLVLPEIARLRAGAPLRVWSAGCGRGEEAYTLAMLLDQAGIDGTIDATDLDPRALRAALDARYSAAAFAELPAALRERYCEPTGEAWVVTAPLREHVRFAQHDLASLHRAPPGAPYDLVCCRNVLIYFDRALQDRALGLFDEALCRRGFLGLGARESVRFSEQGAAFTEIHAEALLYQRSH